MGLRNALFLLIESLFGDPEGPYCRWHASVEQHLADDFGYLLLGDPYMKRPGDVAFDHLGAVAHHHQSGNSTKAASPEVDGRAVVDFAVDHRVHQMHYFRRQCHHGLWWLRVVGRAVVPHPKVGGGLG